MIDEKMCTKYDIISFGQSSIDDIHNEKIKCNNILGGAAIYTAVIAANLGKRVGIVSRIGNDFKESYIKYIIDNGVNINGIKKCKGKSTRIKLKYYHESLILIIINENVNKNINVFDYPEEYFSTKIVHISTAPFNTQLKLSQILNNKNIKISLDPHKQLENKKFNSIKKLLNNVSIIFMNEKEILNITKKDDLNESIKLLKTLKTEIINITLGGKGSLILNKNKIIKIPSFKNNNIIDSVGAGDAYAAGFLSKYLDSNSLYDSGLYGAACAHYIISGIGLTNVPTKEKVEILLKRNKEIDKIARAFNF